MALKFRNVLTEVDGLKFASKKEARRWADLQWLEKAGKITDLVRQPSYDLRVNDMKVCRYVADASYTENGRHVVEDTKSPATRKHPVYRLKFKLFKAVYGFEITEV
jgi:hypothetical protein